MDLRPCQAKSALPTKSISARQTGHVPAYLWMCCAHLEPPHSSGSTSSADTAYRIFRGGGTDSPVAEVLVSARKEACISWPLETHKALVPRRHLLCCLSGEQVGAHVRGQGDRAWPLHVLVVILTVLNDSERHNPAAPVQARPARQAISLQELITRTRAPPLHLGSYSDEMGTTDLRPRDASCSFRAAVSARRSCTCRACLHIKPFTQPPFRPVRDSSLIISSALRSQWSHIQQVITGYCFSLSSTTCAGMSLASDSFYVCSNRCMRWRARMYRRRRYT